MAQRKSTTTTRTSSKRTGTSKAEIGESTEDKIPH